MNYLWLKKSQLVISFYIFILWWKQASIRKRQCSELWFHVDLSAFLVQLRQMNELMSICNADNI